jgi:hypothetical protein
MSAEDRLDVLELNARYSWALDTGDYETYASLFTEDGVFSARGESFQTRPVIQAHVKDIATRMFPGNRHHNTQFLFEEGDSTYCRVRCYTTHIYEPEYGKPNVVRFQGFYRDHCVKVDGVWYFKERAWEEWRSDRLESHRPPPR